MATFKKVEVPDLTGNYQKDMKKIKDFLEEATKELEYVLNNIDTNNFTDEINKKIK